jgi:16S rRNA (adenine1518-N6/adenine1519-N6)-dimethyltransferase
MHSARKRYGQNFLVDTSFTRRIVDAIAPDAADNLAEIGPGLGALTRPLLARLAHLTVIEIDRDLARQIAIEFEPARLTVHNVDALDFDFGSLGANLRVVGNLPYNIASPLLFHLARFDAQLRDLHLMLQKEVVDRMAAKAATPAYGRLSVMLQARFLVERLFIVPPGAFRPAPKVHSALSRLVPLGEAKPTLEDEHLFAQLVAAAFSQRRKTLRNSLRRWYDAPKLELLGVNPGARGEQLPVEDFVRLANAVANG